MFLRTFTLALTTAALVLAGCSGRNGPSLPPAPSSDGRLSPDSDSGKFIKHVVIVIQENRSFDNLFATFPGADGATSGLKSKGQTIQLKKQKLAGALDINHDWK